VKSFLHEHQARSFFFCQLENGDSCGGSKDLGDHAFVHDADTTGFTTSPLLFQLETFTQQSFLFIAQRGSLLEVLAFNGGFFARPNFGNLFIEFPKLGRARQNRQAEPCASLIDEVDGLIGQEAVLHVTVCHVDRSIDRAIGNRNTVEGFVLIPQAFQDIDGVSGGRFIHLDGLEPTLQRRIFLKVLAVLIQCGRTNGL